MQWTFVIRKWSWRKKIVQVKPPFLHDLSPLSTGECLLALVAWRTREWRQTLLIVMAPFFAFLLYWPCLPESVRWQLSHRKFAGAQRTADRMASCNSKQKVPTRKSGCGKKKSVHVSCIVLFPITKKNTQVALADFRQSSNPDEGTPADVRNEDG